MEQSGFDHGGQEQHFHETADQGGAQFSDASYKSDGDGQGNYDNNNLDDTVLDGNLTQDDGGGGFDDGGGFDNGGGDSGGGDFS
jgi:hypothetical protein